MPPSEQEGLETSRTWLEIWSRPRVKLFTAALAAVAAVAKILQFFVAPDVSTTVKLGMWGVLLLALFPFAAQGVVSGVKRLIENAIEKQMRQGNLPSMAAEEEEVTSEVAYVFDSKLYGMAYEELIAHCTIHRDGSATFRREIDLAADSVISSMDHYMLLPEAPRGEEHRLQLGDVESLSAFTEVTSNITELSSGKMSLTVSITPSLNPGQRTRYQIVETSPPGLYAVTGVEERKIPYDYFAWDISRPTKKLEMKVFFPNGVQPLECRADVWYAVGQSRSTHGREYERVKGFLRRKQEGVFYSLVFVVPYPILGLTYVIKWTPPRAR